jgi:hypothetical protein
MRKLRLLKQDVWYEVRTAINNREPLFCRQEAIKVFCRVFGEARERFAFELRGFRLDGERLSFYIRPENGLQLPAIMQWVKQTFAVRFNRCEDRTGHVWGDRYWSRVLAGEPPAEAAEVDWEAVEAAAKTGVISFGPWPLDGVSPLTGETRRKADFRPKTPPIPLPRPAKPPNPAPIRAESPIHPPRAPPPNHGHGRGLPIALPPRRIYT